MTDLEHLRQRLRAFAEARQWQGFHTPKNLAMALSVEASELLEIFQWLTPEQSQALTPAQQAAAQDEVADVLLYLVRLSDELGIDPIAAAQRKLAINTTRFPVSATAEPAPPAEEH